MKKIKIIVIVLFMIIGSCNDSSFDPPIELYYTFSGVKLQNIDNAGEYPVIIENENVVILKEAYGIRVSLNYELLSDSNDNVVKNNFIKNFSFSNKLYATRCDDYPYPYERIIFKDTIINIKVFALNDFDNDFIANSDVTELFKIYDFRKYISIDEYIKKHSISLGYHYQAKENIESIIDLYLMKPPTFTGEHSFRVEVLLSDGKIFSAITPLINLE